MLRCTKLVSSFKGSRSASLILAFKNITERALPFGSVSTSAPSFSSAATASRWLGAIGSFLPLGSISDYSLFPHSTIPTTSSSHSRRFMLSPSVNVAQNTPNISSLRYSVMGVNDRAPPKDVEREMVVTGRGVPNGETSAPANG